jgi:hypothetical protein
MTLPSSSFHCYANFTITRAGKDRWLPEPDQEEHHRIYCFLSRKNHPLKQDPIIS